MEYAAKLRETQSLTEKDPSQESETNTQQQYEQLRLLADRDPLHEFHEQEKKTMWALRYHCLREIPTLLSKLLQCVEWNDHK